MTRATISERRIARNARFTDKASVVLPAETTAALLLIPAVSIRRNFWRKKLIQKNFLEARTNKYYLVISVALQTMWLGVNQQKKQTWPSTPVNSVSIASRVVPLMGLTIVLSSPTSAFKMLLFPTFGLPTIEIEGT